IFSEKELELLNYGLKFNIKPICDPDVVVDIETALKFKSESVKHQIRHGAKHILKEFNNNKKLIHPHVYKEMIEQQAIIKSLQQKDVNDYIVPMSEVSPAHPPFYLYSGLSRFETLSKDDIVEVMPLVPQFAQLLLSGKLKSL
ncbi:hypothetical protein Bhyg_02820, partial [Pseudolycoriella hygida]